MQLKKYIDERATAECDFYEFSDFEFANEEIISDKGFLKKVKEAMKR